MQCALKGGIVLLQTGESLRLAPSGNELAYYYPCDKYSVELTRKASKDAGSLSYVSNWSHISISYGKE